MPETQKPWSKRPKMLLIIKQDRAVSTFVYFGGTYLTS